MVIAAESNNNNNNILCMWIFGGRSSGLFVRLGEEIELIYINE